MIKQNLFVSVEAISVFARMKEMRPEEKDAVRDKQGFAKQNRGLADKGTWRPAVSQRAAPLVGPPYTALSRCDRFRIVTKSEERIEYRRNERNFFILKLTRRKLFNNVILKSMSTTTEVEIHVVFLRFKGMFPN